MLVYLGLPSGETNILVLGIDIKRSTGRERVCNKFLLSFVDMADE